MYYSAGLEDGPEPTSTMDQALRDKLDSVSDEIFTYMRKHDDEIYGEHSLVILGVMMMPGGIKVLDDSRKLLRDVANRCYSSPGRVFPLMDTAFRDTGKVQFLAALDIKKMASSETFDFQSMPAEVCRF
jgi:hypothetical protein